MHNENLFFPPIDYIINWYFCLGLTVIVVTLASAVTMTLEDVMMVVHAVMEVRVVWEDHGQWEEAREMMVALVWVVEAAHSEVISCY